MTKWRGFAIMVVKTNILDDEWVVKCGICIKHLDSFTQFNTRKNKWRLENRPHLK